eukprot:4232253-Pleurochrysis_carterae.AAC.1
MESIVDVRFAHVRKGKWTTLGLVKWKGWGRASDNTWKDLLTEINDEELLAQARACLERQDAERRAKDAACEEEMNRMAATTATRRAWMVMWTTVLVRIYQ